VLRPVLTHAPPAVVPPGRPHPPAPPSSAPAPTPRCSRAQARPSPVVGPSSATSSNRSTHFTLYQQTRPSATVRRGAPCSGGSGCPWRCRASTRQDGRNGDAAPLLRGHHPARITDEIRCVRLRPQRVDLAEGQRGGLGHQAIHPQPPVLWCVANPAGTGCAGSASRRSGCSCIRLSLAGVYGGPTFRSS